MRNVRWSWQTNHVDNVLILKIQMKCCLCFCFARVLISGIRAVQSVWSQISFNAGWPLIRHPLLFKLNCYILFIPNENFSNELSTFIICVTPSLLELVTYRLSLYSHSIVPPSPGLVCTAHIEQGELSKNQRIPSNCRWPGQSKKCWETFESLMFD